MHILLTVLPTIFSHVKLVRRICECRINVESQYSYDGGASKIFSRLIERWGGGGGEGGGRLTRQLVLQAEG